MTKKYLNTRVNYTASMAEWFANLCVKGRNQGISKEALRWLEDRKSFYMDETLLNKIRTAMAMRQCIGDSISPYLF